jgi:sugar/nucleoside kinase (ribokinase family)
MKKTCLLSGNFALDTIVTRDYPNGFVVGKSNKFTETIAAETVGNTCGNVACMLAYLGVQSFPIAHFDLSEQGVQIKSDLKRYGADVRFVENSASGGTTLLRCTHKRDKATGDHTVSFRATSPGSRFPKRRFLRVRDEAPAFMENLDFTPDVFFFDAAEAGLRYLAAELRKRGTLVYFEPESDADKNKFLKAVEASDIVKFSHEKVSDLDFVAQNPDKLFIRTMGAEGLEFNLCGQGWVKIAPVPNDNVVDWEGAGDWTTSQFIACLCENDMLSVAQMTAETVRSCLENACRTASRSVSYMGSKGMIGSLNNDK